MFRGASSIRPLWWARARLRAEGFPGVLDRYPQVRSVTKAAIFVGRAALEPCG